MTTLSEVRKAILNQVVKSNDDGKVSWSFIEDDESVQADFTSFQFHIDKKMLMAERSYKIFLLNDEGEVVDSYIVRKTTGGTPDSSNYDSYYAAVDKIYRTEEERVKVNDLSMYLEKLKRI